MKKYFLSVTYTVLCALAFAQDQQSAITNEMKKLVEVYKASGSISFNAAYYYADEQSPKAYLDSLKGSFKIYGTRFWYDLNETEAMSSDDYVVMLFKEDMIIYLAKPASSTQSMNPLAVLDSFFISNKSIRGSVTESQTGKKLTLDFPPGQKYKKIEYYVNGKTGLIDRMVNVVESGMLYDDESGALANRDSQYAVVEVVFSQYKKGIPVSNEFDKSRYFKKSGNEYLPVSPYESYKIFLGSPNL